MQTIEQEQEVDNYSIVISVQVTYNISACFIVLRCVQNFKINYYKTNSPQNQSNYQDTDKYTHLATLSASNTNFTSTFTLTPSEDGFYLAFQDEGTCIELVQVIVYQLRCPPQQVGLVSYPDTPSPLTGQVEVQGSCKDGAHPEGSLTLMCNSDGTWSGSPACSCDVGYKQINNDSDTEFACEGTFVYMYTSLFKSGFTTSAIHFSAFSFFF